MEGIEFLTKEICFNKKSKSIKEDQGNAKSRISIRKAGFDDPILRNTKPDDFYFNQTRTKFLLSQQSFKLATKPEELQKKNTISKSKADYAPNFKDLNDIIPEWLTSRADFQKSYIRMKQVENADLESIVTMNCNQRNDDEKRAIFMWIKSTEYFKNMPKIIIKEICDRIILVKFKEGEKSKDYLVIKQGSKADCLFIIYKGTVGIFVNGVKIAHNSEGGNFGDLALDKSSPRTADVIALTPVVLFTVKEFDYRNIIFNYKNIEKHENCKFVSSIPFFSNWSIVKVQLMCNSLVQLSFKPGEVIYEFGDRSHVFNLIKSGKIEIQTLIDLKQKNRWPVGPHIWNIRKVISKYVFPIKTVGNNEFFGEFEILKNIDRETRAVAIEDTVCLSLNKSDFDILFTVKDQENLNKLIETYIPSKDEMEQKLRERISAKYNNEQILLEAMKINYMPNSKESLIDKRSKKLQKWIQSIKSRKSIEDEQIKSRRIQNITKNKIKGGVSQNANKDGQHSQRISSGSPTLFVRNLHETRSKSGIITPINKLKTEMIDSEKRLSHQMPLVSENSNFQKLIKSNTQQKQMNRGKSQGFKSLFNSEIKSLSSGITSPDQLSPRNENLSLRLSPPLKNYSDVSSIQSIGTGIIREEELR
ncbi:hypothetical protein SteCoe_12738 [Stentor coeruleus]|uniref:Cyclic nucleotide-binding domain-containing protein n=1 Tax=Stentor coeruleus TaxID=5963 RepID=A0A1R2C9Y4_9CILI|nr:hypothetical protein SteCoe_12738 [Stentor coeruleus]